MEHIKKYWWVYLIIVLIIIWYVRDNTGYKKCLKDNKKKQEGEECGSCTPDGSKMSVFMGTIKNGICVASQNERKMSGVCWCDTLPPHWLLGCSRCNGKG